MTKPRGPPSMGNENRDQGGWITVKSRSHVKRLRNPRGTLPKLRPILNTGELRSCIEIDTEYRHLKAQWERGPSCAAVRRLIRANASAIMPVRVAVCLGIGTFDPEDMVWESKTRTFTQLIAFLAIVDELEKYDGRKIRCIFQDPIFSVSDREFITELGHEVVESPLACQMIDDKTLLYAIHLYRPIYALALKDNLPSCFIGTGWDAWDRTIMGGADDLDRVKIMDETYRKQEFPQDKDCTAFSSTSIYWRPAIVDQDDAVSGDSVALDTYKCR